MVAFAAVVAAWGALGLLLLGRLSGEYERCGATSSTSAALIWAWHALGYAALIIAAFLSLWPIGLSRPLAVSAGASLVIIGLGAIAAGFYEFRSLGRLTGTRADRLVDSGIYRYSRHPQYLGIVVADFGIALASRSGLGIAFAALLTAGMAIYTPIEERHLRRVFGDAYGCYQARTAMLLGRPRGPE